MDFVHRPYTQWFWKLNIIARTHYIHMYQLYNCTNIGKLNKRGIFDGHKLTWMQNLTLYRTISSSTSEHLPAGNLSSSAPTQNVLVLNLLLTRWAVSCLVLYCTENLAYGESPSSHEMETVSVRRIQLLSNTKRRHRINKYVSQHTKSASLLIKGENNRKSRIFHTDITLYEHIPVFANTSASLNYYAAVKPQL
jgi:hypothetical protein